jgi:hypothetical protein
MGCLLNNGWRNIYYYGGGAGLLPMLTCANSNKQVPIHAVFEMSLQCIGINLQKHIHIIIMLNTTYSVSSTQLENIHTDFSANIATGRFNGCVL